ncbi:hypothetical protein PV08_05203 [Exophiala spinifera]|uniref:Uncharacterized protein n=1 Tax=Exophiala spinifera TaxID=91928 RepID=A0A0D2B8B5_9EURO|nr:uncharacterized protein PV08_05203 [Exophiala spinifera]KIW15158.1 hypothetical protein PV08_05203 [Exophiala spinifera]
MSYFNTGGVACATDFDHSHAKGKTAIITGGANGIGEGYARALVACGVHVVVADMDEGGGAKLEKEFPGLIKFIKCNVTVWADQLALFNAALSWSPSGRIDTVIANAGISGGDSIFQNDITQDQPEEPELNILKVNLVGVLYTVKLALFFFRKQSTTGKANCDQSLIFTGSLAGYLDVPGAPQYTSAKYGLRGLMKTLRRSEVQYCTRVNYIAPWWIRSTLLSKDAAKYLDTAGMAFATVDDAGQAVARIVSTPSINGRAFGIVPRKIVSTGYVDLDVDDYEEDSLLGKLGAQAVAINHRGSLNAAKQKTRTQW